jgi:hypothetical protein
MNNCKRTTILIVDKQDKCMDYFKGLRKNKFRVKFSKSVLDTTETELEQTDIFFVVLYKPVEFIQLVKISEFKKAAEMIKKTSANLFKKYRGLISRRNDESKMFEGYYPI